MIAFAHTLLADLRAGRALRRLHEAKRMHGLDWCAHSSWCSDQSLVVILVRAPGVKPAVGSPLLELKGEVGEALRRAEERARAPWRRSEITNPKGLAPK